MNMLQDAIDLMLNTGSDEWTSAFYQMPGLMAEEVLERLEFITRDMPSEIETRVSAFIHVAHHVEEQMRTCPGGYPLGKGPLEQLFLRQKQGHMGVDVTKQQARDMALKKILHPSYLGALSYRCVQLSYQGQPEDALDIQMLILVAAEAMLDASQHSISVKLAAEFIRSAVWLLHEKGNAKVYHEALTIGEKGLAQAKTDEERAELEQVLGIFYLDPYAANRTPDWYTVGIRQWFAAGENPDGCELGGEEGLPLPAVALAAAESRLRSAISLSEGKLRRDALKALVQTLESGRNVDRQPDERGLVELCDETLELLEQWPNPDQQRYVHAVREKATQNLNTPPSEVAEQPQLDSLEALVGVMGGQAAVDAWVTAIGLMVNRAPNDVLMFASIERKLFMHYASEALKETLWRHELVAMSELADKQPKSDNVSAESLAIWQAVKCGLEAPAKDNEKAALEKLVATFEGSPEPAQQHIDALRWLAAILEIGLGANAFNTGDYETAARHYSLSLQTFVGLEQAKSSCEVLERLHEIIILDGDSLNYVTIGLSNTAVRLDCLMGTHALKVLDPIGNTLIQRYVSTKGKLIGLIWAMEFAKSRIFRALLRQGKTTQFEPSPNLLQTLNDIHDLERRMQNNNLDENDSSEESVLGAFYTETAPSAGNELGSQLRNLRLTFDQSVTRERLLRLEHRQTIITDEDSISKKLPTTTVLIDIYNAGRIRLNLAYTSEGVEAFVIDDHTELGGAQVTLADDTISASFRYSAIIVELVREHICAEPGPFEIDRKASSILDTMLRSMLGHGVERLQEWWDMGKRHLCFVPHGAQHFLPFHLMPWNGKPLADQWTITYLPSIALIADDWTPVNTRHGDAIASTALGLSYSNHPFLRPIDNSIREVNAVASAMGVFPVINEDVTKSRVKQAFASCSHIHISCHGKLDPESPELQHLYLAPDSKLEEKLFAYEISGLDLRHVELVSLSACQSGLGRFDQGDNLRGIQANLFISGVRTIVDTLWEVSAKASETFFTIFYEQLNNGAPILNAFRNAQETTRQKHRAYRDWGAFRLSGKW